MDLSLSLPQLGRIGRPAEVASVARGAERMGFVNVWVIDRLLAPVAPRTRAYPGSPDGSLPPVFGSCLDPLETLAFAAAHSSTIGLGTSVLVLPWYRPLDLARRLSTLDVLSGGRLRIGLGVGWSQDEFRGLGVDRRRRGALTDEALTALLHIWNSDPVQFRGEGFDIARARTGPKPVQRPHPPLYFGGTGTAALRRIARHGAGWMPFGLPLGTVTSTWQQILHMTEDAGRDPARQRLIVRAGVAITETAPGKPFPFVGSLAAIAGEIRRHADAGVDEVHLDLQFTHGVTTADRYLDLAAALLDRVGGGQLAA